MKVKLLALIYGFSRCKKKKERNLSYNYKKVIFIFYLYHNLEFSRMAEW
jgi:hypothetical protein